MRAPPIAPRIGRRGSIILRARIIEEAGMITLRDALVACFAAAVLTACGSDSTTSTSATSTARGTLQEMPPLRIASVDAPTFKAQLGATTSGAQLLQVTGNP